jgi:cytochrome c-type biogenesis protein CcmH/NrfF
MGAALIVPVIALLVLGLIWVATAARRTRQAARDEATLPADPYERRQEERRRLEEEHADADPSRTSHPARRP